VLLEVLEQPEAERSAALERLCGADDALRAEVESLLAREAPATGDLLPTHPASLVPTAPVDTVGEGDEAGRAIGSYRLGASIGEGGMGVVYRATQEGPLRRDVALKLIKPGMDSAGVIARFEAERQALALMDHPFIARVFDAGTAESGRPYFVMELVEGEPLTAFCAREGLGVRERLALFLLVCQAVQHAHQKGMIHRDLKPSNILVARRDGRPAPKVIDFGIAKAVADPLGTGPLLTREGLAIGTPEYMSPEQAGVVAGGVDTRSDVYSLGVILYELLVGRLPLVFGPASSGEEVRRILANQTPTRPSLAVRSEADDTVPDEGAGGRGRRRLSRALAGDLDNVVMTALHKDRDRRYPSVEQLAEDVRRHLESRPVRARPDSLAYRASRFARRHRAGVAVGAVAAVLLTLAGAGLVVQSWRVARERDRALVAETRAREQAARARSEADTSREVSRFLVELFEVADPARSRGEEVSVLDLVDQGAARIEKELAGQPEIQGRLLGTLGQVHHALGRYEEAEALIDRALTQQRQALGEEHLEVARSLDMLGTILHDRGEYTGSEALYREALDLRQRLAGDSPQVAESLNHLAISLQAQGDAAGAEPFYRQALEINRRTLGPEHPETAWSLNSLAWAIHAQGRLAEAEPLYREALSLQRQRLGDVHPDVGHTLNNLGGVRYNLGDFGEAEELWREALAVYRALFGEHAAVARALHVLGNVLRQRGRLDEAEPLLREALEMNRRLLGDGHPYAATTRWGVAMVELERGRLGEAEALLRASLEAYHGVLDDSHRLVVASRESLARVVLRRGRVDEAESMARRLVEEQRVSLPDGGTVRLAGSLRLLGEVLRARGRAAEAEEALRESLGLFRELLPEGHPDTGGVLVALGEVRLEAGDPREAASLLEEGLASRRRVLPPDHPELATIGAALELARGASAD
jgi:serine/threonine protein kinase/tetratricopeptide (TPR) repeat protein